MSVSELRTYGFSKSQDNVTIQDVAPCPKRSRTFHDSVGAGYIPEIGVAMKFTKDTEHLSVSLPETVFSRIPVLRDIPESSRGQKAPLDQETGERIDAGVPYPSIELPGSLWDLLIVLKGVLEGELDEDALFMHGEDVSTLATSLQVARHLQWQEGEDAISRWLRARWLAYHPRNNAAVKREEPQLQSGRSGLYLRLCKAMRALPDAHFALPATGTEGSGSGGPPPRLLDTVADACSLPPHLKVKWLRANALQALDLSNPGGQWGLSAWQRMAMCLHAVPSLEVLRVKLPPRAAAPQPRPAAPSKPPIAFMTAAPVATAQATKHPLRGFRCSSCEKTKLHVHCTSCRIHVRVEPDLTHIGGGTKPLLGAVPKDRSESSSDEELNQKQQPQSSSPCASLEAIHALHDASASLPNLKSLDLCESSFSWDHAAALAAALASFADTLEQLEMSASHLFRCDSTSAAALPASSRQADLFGGFSHMTRLKSIYMHDWDSVCCGSSGAGSFREAEALAKLPALEAVLVGTYPCEQCQRAKMQCPLHPSQLPFRQHGTDYSIIL